MACLPVCLFAGSSQEGQPAARVASVVRTDVHSGKLVRRMVLASQPAPALVAAAAPAAIANTVSRIAAEHSLPPELIESVIRVESNYNPYAVSPKGALGMMQLIPSTARRFGVSDVFNPVDNIQGGARYLKYLLDLYHGQYPLALAAYNAGEDAVARYGGVPPFAETQQYVSQVSKRIKAAPRTSPAPVATQAVNTPVPEDPSAPRHIVRIVEPDGTMRYVSR